jgi:hypothetical protein
MTSDTIDYAAFIDKAMRGAVRDILRQIEVSELPGQHHFFISYRTDYPGVEMSDALRAKYPKEITIVLQHQFWDLRVEDTIFRVSLSFSNVPERLVIPFAALTGFADPSTKFGLQFHSAKSDAADGTKTADGKFSDIPSDDELPKESAQIIALDAFRKK